MRRALLSALLIGVAALAGCAPGEEAGRPGVTFETAPFTADEPRVSRLRQAADGANVVICVIDAARADHLGCYGYPRDTTPNIDRLAAESVRFERHYCQHVTTKPSTAALLTSQHTDTHLATENRHFLEGTFTMAEGLEGALLIAHGMIDQNVHFQDTVRLVERLIELGKDNWEVAIYPKEDHEFKHAWSWTDEYNRVLRLFEENLD